METAYRAYVEAASKKGVAPLPVNSFGKELLEAFPASIAKND